MTVNVPRTDSCEDVFEFSNENTITAALPDENYCFDLNKLEEVSGLEFIGVDRSHIVQARQYRYGFEEVFGSRSPVQVYLILSPNVRYRSIP